MEDKLLSRRAFAKETGMSHTWVGDKVKEGYITLQDGKIPYNRALSELRDSGMLGEKESKEGGFPPLLRSKERLEFYKAEKAQIEIGILKGEIFYKKDLRILHGSIDTLLNYAIKTNELFAEGYFQVDMDWRKEHNGVSRQLDAEEEMEDYYGNYIDTNPKIKEAEEMIEKMERLIGNLKKSVNI